MTKYSWLELLLGPGLFLSALNDFRLNFLLVYMASPALLPTPRSLMGDSSFQGTGIVHRPRGKSPSFGEEGEGLADCREGFRPRGPCWKERSDTKRAASRAALVGASSFPLPIPAQLWQMFSRESVRAGLAGTPPRNNKLSQVKLYRGDTGT